MKTFKKIILSLLITIGVSNVNLNSMIRDGFLVNPDDGSLTTYSQELLESVGFTVDHGGRVHDGGHYVSGRDVINALFTYLMNMPDTQALPTFDIDYTVTQAELNEEEAQGGYRWGLRERVIGRYYDFADSLEYLNNYLNNYLNTVRNSLHNVREKYIHIYNIYDKACEFYGRTCIQVSEFNNFFNNFINKKISEISATIKRELNTKVVIEIIAGSTAIIRLVGSISGIHLTTNLEQIIELLALSGIGIDVIKVIRSR